MRSPPNATRILNDWGIGDCLREEGVVSGGILFKAGEPHLQRKSDPDSWQLTRGGIGETGEVIGHIRFVPRIIKDFGANFCYLRVRYTYFLLITSKGIWAGPRFHSALSGERDADLIDILFGHTQHNTLTERLRQLAVNSGCTIRYNCKVVKVDAGEGSVRLQSGEVVSGNIVIGADGKGSRVREVVIGRPLHTRRARHACFK